MVERELKRHLVLVFADKLHTLQKDIEEVREELQSINRMRIYGIVFGKQRST